ncbi:MAG: hypothetical protein HY276_07740 [Ignavibacteriales bacterium]|nr:hypothetical protein [Ignavibacteriales bacterium]MBI3788134.1 hypothetical protein [Ignavibacteriales bacterium]
MKKGLAISLLLIFVLFQSCEESPIQLLKPQKTSDFFPLKTGNTWTFNYINEIREVVFSGHWVTDGERAWTIIGNSDMKDYKIYTVLEIFKGVKYYIRDTTTVYYMKIDSGKTYFSIYVYPDSTIRINHLEVGMNQFKRYYNTDEDQITLKEVSSDGISSSLWQLTLVRGRGISNFQFKYLVPRLSSTEETLKLTGYSLAQ